MHSTTSGFDNFDGSTILPQAAYSTSLKRQALTFMTRHKYLVSVHHGVHSPWPTDHTKRPGHSFSRMGIPVRKWWSLPTEMIIESLPPNRNPQKPMGFLKDLHIVGTIWWLFHIRGMGWTYMSLYVIECPQFFLAWGENKKITETSLPLGLLRSKNTSFQTTIWIGCLPLFPAISELCDPKVQGSGLRSTTGLGNLVPNLGGSAQDQWCLCGEWLGVSRFVGRSCWDSDVSWFLATCCLENHWTSLNLNFIEVHWTSLKLHFVLYFCVLSLSRKSTSIGRCQ